MPKHRNLFQLNLKSSLDRFIAITFYAFNSKGNNLKSSLDRFIVEQNELAIQLYNYLKSSLDRFIGLILDCMFWLYQI